MARVTTETTLAAPRMSKASRTRAPNRTSQRSAPAHLPQRALGAVATLRALGAAATLPARTITAQQGVLARGKLDGARLPPAAAQVQRVRLGRKQVAAVQQVRSSPKG